MEIKNVPGTENASVELDFMVTGSWPTNWTWRHVVEAEAESYAEAFNGETTEDRPGGNPITVEIVSLSSNEAGQPRVKFTGPIERVAGLFAHHRNVEFDKQRQRYADQVLRNGGTIGDVRAEDDAPFVDSAVVG